MPDQGLNGGSPGLEQARLWLSNHRDLKGARLILAIMPGIKENHNFTSKRQTALNCPGRPYRSGGRIREEPVPMTDWKALAAYRNRSAQLIKEIEADLQLGLAGKAAEKRAEFDFIQRHIREITKPDGKIKNFPSSVSKDYQRVFQQLRFLLQKAKQTDPEVYLYLKAHLRTGATFAWIPDK